MTSLVCPRGHDSAEPDFCSVCGAKMQAAGESAPHGVITRMTICPDCGARRESSEIVFCELCGFNFTTGAHGELKPVAATPAPPVSEALVEPTPLWQVIVQVDAALRAAESPEAPVGTMASSIALKKDSNLIGRLSERRGVFPDVALDTDDAVSHRHALLNIASDGTLVLRDIGSSNGTRLNGTDLQPMTDTPLKDGDEITLGHWTRLQIKALQARVV